MKRLYETILGLLSFLVIFSHPAESKKITHISNDYHVPDVQKITSLDQVELLPNPPPLILKQIDFDTGDMFAGHRSHSSHSSHSSHRSHASHASGSSAPAQTPKEETPLEKKPTESTSPQKSAPTETSVKEWKISTEWQSEPCKLYHHEIVVILNSGGGHNGLVTECKRDSIEIIDQIKKTKKWIKLEDIKGLMWK